MVRRVLQKVSVRLREITRVVRNSHKSFSKSWFVKERWTLCSGRMGLIWKASAQQRLSQLFWYVVFLRQQTLLVEALTALSLSVWSCRNTTTLVWVCFHFGWVLAPFDCKVSSCRSVKHGAHKPGFVPQCSGKPWNKIRSNLQVKWVCFQPFQNYPLWEEKQRGEPIWVVQPIPQEY